ERVGRYDQSATANRKAIEFDNAYRPFTGSMDFFPMYSGHNMHFLGYTMMKQGRGAEALEKSSHLKDMIPIAMLQMMPGYDVFLGEPDYVMVRFERWDDILAAAPPPAEFPFLRGLRHWARGMAFAGKGQLDQAAVEAESLTAVQKSLPADMPEGFNTG